jgi:deoxyribodipyrimidine photo-lyase
VNVPGSRIRVRGPAPADPGGAYVLYWMTMARRPGWSFALQRAVEWARELERPLVILEALRVGYRWASDRLHRFILDGMADHARVLAARPVLYYPYVEPAPGAGKGLLAALAARAAVVVTDDFPAFMLPRMTDAAARQVAVRFEQVDGNGLLPLRAADRVFPTAYAFRRFLQRTLPEHLRAMPAADPLARARLPRLAGLSREVVRRWPPASPELLAGRPGALAALPVDHGVSPVDRRGGPVAGGRALGRFVDERLPDYPRDRNLPEADGTSGLSPYLHFGHVSVHQVLDRLARPRDWSPDLLTGPVTGKRAGWWRMGLAAEAFLDELVTWRELGYTTCALDPGYDRYDSLPAWARATLARHAADPRPHRYDLQALQEARTHDPLWNAAQTQLRREGRIHNYLRMLWGKKILEWSATPEEALATMIELNNRFAVDGRNPNSYSGIFWVLGRYDRPWAPERPIFGRVRYMSSANTARKMRVTEYLRRYAP